MASEARAELDALLSEKLSDGAPSKAELFSQGMRSKPQWLASVVFAIPWFLQMYTDRRVPTFTQGIAVLFIFLMFLFLVRLIVFVAVLMLRVALCFALLLAAGVVWIIDAFARSSKRRAEMLVDRAEAILSGIYFRSGHRAPARDLPRTDDLTTTLVLREDLVVHWSLGSRGKLSLIDAVVPSFEATLATGETVVVTMDAGAIELDATRADETREERSFPLVGDTRRTLLVAGTPIHVARGTWIDVTSELAERAGFRDAPTRKRLVGTIETPLDIRAT